MNISSFKIRALDRFILNELKAPFFFGLVAFTIILVAGGLPADAGTYETCSDGDGAGDL